MTFNMDIELFPPTGLPMSDQYVKLEEERRQKERAEKKKKEKKKRKEKRSSRGKKHDSGPESEEDITPAHMVDIVTEEMPEVRRSLMEPRWLHIMFSNPESLRIKHRVCWRSGVGHSVTSVSQHILVYFL